MRYTILDGFRGFFLLFMGLIHFNEVTHVWLGKLNHHYFGWVEDAQGFVFISGLVVGLVYGGTLLRRGSTEMTKRVFRRIRTIYSHQAALILLFAATAMAYVVIGHGPAPHVLHSYEENPGSFTLASLALIANSRHMGILPMYIWFMAITPFVLILFHRGYFYPVLMASILAWITAQMGLMELVSQRAENVLSLWGAPVDLGLFFNILGWQVIYFSGLAAGFLVANKRLDLNFLKQPQYLPTFLIGLAGAFALGIFDRIVFDFWFGHDYSRSVLETTNRPNLSVLYVVAFFLDLFLITWLLVAGKECGVKLIEQTSQFVEWVFTRRFLVFLGQHSLHVFSYHILVVYFLWIVAEDQTFSQLGGSLVLILATGSIYLPAWANSRMQVRQKKMRDAQLSTSST